MSGKINKQKHDRLWLYGSSRSRRNGEISRRKPREKAEVKEREVIFVSRTNPFPYVLIGSRTGFMLRSN